MKLKFARDDLAADALSQPDEEALATRRYSEWHHFTFFDEAQGLCGIVNLAVSGDMRSPEGGRAAVSLVVCERGRGWSGTMNLHGSEEAEFRGGSVDLRIAANAVRLAGGRYHVAAALKDGSVQIEAIWTPQTEAVRIENMGGFINTFIVPRLGVEGRLKLAGREFRLSGATGYHDHNWGAWNWSHDLGWNWGYVLQPDPGADGGPPASIVFGQVTDALRSSARTELVLMCWQGRTLTHVFTDRAVSLLASGRSDIRAPRVPGVMALLHRGRGGTIPARLEVEASDGADRLHIDFQAKDAVEFLIPHPFGSRYTSVSELSGDYTVRGTLDGRGLDFSCSAFAELAGARGQAENIPRIRLGASV